jgi:predicted helicase
METLNIYTQQDSKHKNRQDTVKIDLKEIDCEDIDWNQLIPNSIQIQALVNTVINLWVPQKQDFLDHLSNCNILKKASTPYC